MVTVGVRTCGVQDTLECLASYQEGDYSGIMLRLEYSNRTITNCGDLLDSNVASMGSAIACLSSAHLNKRRLIGLNDIYLMPKCCSFQYVFFLCQVDYALELVLHFHWTNVIYKPLVCLSYKRYINILLLLLLFIIVSHWEVVEHISIYCGFLFQVGRILWLKNIFLDLFWSVKLFIMAE